MELLLRRGLLRRRAREDRVVGIGARQQDRQRDGNQHEDDCTPRRELGEEVSRSARAKSGLRSLSAERAGQIGRLALLQQYNPDQEQADDDVNDN